MKPIIKLAVLVAVLTTGAVHAASQIDPTAKTFMAMSCRWELDSGKLTDKPQAFTVYQSATGKRWLEIESSDSAKLPKIIYTQKAPGGFIGKYAYKEFYWLNDATRLTLVQDKDKDPQVTIEDIYNASMPLSAARCVQV